MKRIMLYLLLIIFISTLPGCAKDINKTSPTITETNNKVTPLLTPTVLPIVLPIVTPTIVPTFTPTIIPTVTPTIMPTIAPSDPLQDSFDVNQYDGEWYSEGYYLAVDNDNNELYDFGSYLILDSKNMKIDITDTSYPPMSRIAEVDTSFSLEESKGEFTFDDDGWGCSGTGTIEFNKDEVIINIIVTVYGGDNWEIYTGEEVYTRNKTIIVEDNSNLESWIGEYSFYEFSPPDENMIYDIIIYKENEGFYAKISIDGFQTLERDQAEVIWDENSVKLVFMKYLPDNMYEIYEKGDILLSFEKKDFKIITTWGEIEPMIITNKTPSEYFTFEKE